eukprot:TRINITY_DN65149_c0_g1_i1.p1 TRINITY_DN65149_c0_g1~~TRINITY_DN65149_c0_g1_i1.p1  ORF type:complete len:602 (+),score=67.50 TRINITY_DN65149_c0_g1_i1:176-1807(+)
MKCVTMTTFLSFETLRSYQALEDECLLESPQRDAVVHFISHEWLSLHHPDPTGLQLRRMQSVFKTLLDGLGHTMFEESDWRSFLKGTSKGSATAAQKVEKQVVQASSKSDDAVVAEVSCGLVWIDFVSVPQLCEHAGQGAKRRRSSVAGESSLQKAAIRSIPAYVEACSYFWILAPQAAHVDNAKTCNVHTWRSRGWCRLEQWANALSARPKAQILVTSANTIKTIGYLDFMLSNLGRPEAAVCNGEFTCCALNHVSRGVRFPCDKIAVSQVLWDLCQHQQSKFRRTGQRAMYCLYLCLKRTILDGSPHSCSPGEAGETIESFLRRIQYVDLKDVDELGHTPLHWAAYLADPTLVRTMVSANPSLVHVCDDIGLSSFSFAVYRPDFEFAQLLNANLGFEKHENINAVTMNGLSILDRAAKFGFAQKVELLVAHRADVHMRRKDNGRTALLSAAEAGHSACCKVLLQNFADVHSAGTDGCTGLHLAADFVTLEGNSNQRERLSVAKVLLDFSADPASRDANGRTPRDIAQAHGFLDMLSLLVEK